MSTLTDSNNNYSASHASTLKNREVNLSHASSLKSKRSTIKNQDSTQNKPFLDLDQYTVAIRRFQEGNTNLSDLGQSIKERAIIEQNYANSLKSWADKASKSIVKGSEYNTTRQAWLDGLEEARSLSAIHQSVSENLIANPHKKILEWQKKHYTSKMLGGYKEVEVYEKNFRKAQKQWSKLFKAQITAKKAYHNNCMKTKTSKNLLQNLELQLSQLQEEVSPKVEGCQAKIKKQKDLIVVNEKAVDSSRASYKKSIDECSSKKSSYENDMRIVYEQIQAEEEGRLRFVKEIFFETHQKLDLSVNGIFQEIYKKHMCDLEKINPAADVKWWHNARGMGIAMNWPIYEEYDTDSLMKSVAYNQSQRASKDMPGSSSIEAKAYRLASNESSEVTNQYRNEFESEERSNPFGETDQNRPSAEVPNTIEDHIIEKINTIDNVRAYNGWDQNGPQQHTASISDQSSHQTTEPASVTASIAVKQGSVTVAEMSPVKEREVLVLYDYEAVEEDELNLVAGTKILRLELADEQGWCRGKLVESGGVGLFPAEYVRDLEPGE